jgi:chemotaxis family two-component system response regulator Rcp1
MQCCVTPEIRLLEILLVEDNPGDIRLTQEAFTAGDMPHTLHVVQDGEKAIAFLRKKGAYENVPRPDFILLDLNLPRKDGREVLAEIKTDPDLLRIPVVILTTSESDQDILQSYNLHANCYLTKPVGWNQFSQMIQQIESFWMKLVKLPPR